MATRRRSRLRTSLLAAVGLLAATGCTVSAAAPDSTTLGTVGDVGELPGSLSDDVAVAAESADTAAAEATVAASDVAATDLDVESTVVPPSIPIAQSIGEQVSGNRLLMIGDSITASISQRYGGQACDALVPLGWQVEVDAETGRFIDFGARVLDKRLDAGWDAAVIFLGNNYGYDRGVFQVGLHNMLLRLVPRPTILITTTMFRPQQAEVNAAIIEEANQFDSVTVLDWAAISEDPSLTGGDGLHLTEKGRNTLGFFLAAALGEAPQQPDQPGTCLKTNYRDDSAGSPNGPSGNATVNKPPRTTTPSRPTPTTAKPTATTSGGSGGSGGSGSTSTTKPGGTGTTAPSSSSTAPTPSTAAPSTAAPSTAAPLPTIPPVTLPPSTAPPATTQPPPPVTTQPPAPTTSGP